jgi:alpha-L-rhamnosidase
VLRPHPGGELTFARGSYRSVRGVIKAGWEISGGEFAYRVEIPANVTATVILPGDSVGDGAGGAGVPGDAGRRVGPGRYEFRERAARIAGE